MLIVHILLWNIPTSEIIVFVQRESPKTPAQSPDKMVVVDVLCTQ